MKIKEENYPRKAVAQVARLAWTGRKLCDFELPALLFQQTDNLKTAQ
jgi:hypothetical protein